MDPADVHRAGPSSKRACDQCHARKVQCSGTQPCGRCDKAAAICTYLNPLRPKGPKPKRKRDDRTEPDFESALVLQATSPSFNDIAARILSWQVQQPPEVGPISSDLSPLLTVTLDALVRPQLQVFMNRIYPMMPIYKSFEVYARLQSSAWMGNSEWIALLFSMTALSLVHPLDSSEPAERDLRTKQAMILMDEACRLNSKWHLGVTATVESTMTSYCMFGALHEMGYASAARLRLREAISLGEAMALDRSEGYAGLDAVEAQRRMRLFWILTVTERAYALQRTGQLTFDRLNRLPLITGEDPEALLLRHLSSIFSSVDRKLVACWNGKCAKEACEDLKTEQAVSTLHRLQGSVEDVFGKDETLSRLNEAQKADLLITWQWMRSRVWELAFTHGITLEDGPEQLSTSYVLDIAKTVHGICTRLSQTAMEHHGKGFAEKLFDIASLAARQPPTTPSGELDSTWIATVHGLMAFVSRHPASSFDSSIVLETMLQDSIDRTRVYNIT